MLKAKREGGTEMFKIEMREVPDGPVTETITTDHIHFCVGNLFLCEHPAVCEECGHSASVETPVYVWTDSRGISYWACVRCLKDDPYVQVVTS